MKQRSLLLLAVFNFEDKFTANSAYSGMGMSAGPGLFTKILQVERQ